MVRYLKGATDIHIRKRGKIHTIMDIDLGNELMIYVLPGTISPNDILIKFKDGMIPRTKARQPSHIHWAVDLLIKKDNEPLLVNDFLSKIFTRWTSITPLLNRRFITIRRNLQLSRNVNFISSYSKLEFHGFFSMNFLVHLIELLMIQEKTNNPDAYMFKNVVVAVQEHKDLYSIISKATYHGG